MRLKLLLILFLISGALPAQPYSNTTCATAMQIISGQVYSYPAWTGFHVAETGPDYYCLTTYYNPAWFYFVVGSPGNIDITMTSVCSSPPPACLDIDFILWGPFDNLAEGCNGGLTASKVVDCTYTYPCTEGATVPFAQAGKFYILMIPVYPPLVDGTITLSQTGGTGTMTCLPDLSLQGTVSYANIASTGLDSCTIDLLTSPNVLYDTAHTNAEGFYDFRCLDSGSYTLSPHCAKQWGGGNAVDALLIMRYSVGMITLNELQKKVSDVNLSGYTNATDALLVMRRFTEQINSFPAGDWCFMYPPLISMDNSVNTVNISALCYGDVNASFSPP